MSFNGKVAIVTGSATGIGAAVAKLLASKAVRVVINYTRSEAEAEAVAAQCSAEGAEILLERADVSDDGACRRIVEAAVKKWGHVDYLVNNAGATRFVNHADLDGLTADDFQRTYAVNVVGAFQMCRAVAPHMKRSGQGAIVNVSAAASLTATGSSIAYAASKSALNTLTMSLARVLGPEIRVNAVCPGLVRTRWMKDGLGPERYAAIVKKIESASSLKSVSTPEDIAEPIVWLLESARHITGGVIPVDAGFHLARP